MILENEQRLKTTPVKDQAHTSTCWSFATISFIETELLRMGKGAFNLSEMFIVRKTYPRKASRYVRLHGKMSFGANGLAGDALRVVREYGVVPEAVYDGNFLASSKHDYQELDAVVRAALDAVIGNRKRQLSKAWPMAIEGILDAYLGKVPDRFSVATKSYTAKSFIDHLGVCAKDYVELTSFTHHPFYSWFPLDVPDNWSLNQYFNLPLPEFMKAVDRALDNGYSLVWDGDITEHSFCPEKGLALLPKKVWDERTREEKAKVCDAFEPEKNVTQELRQESFDNYTSTDDHLMHVIGTASDHAGTKYYICKNSWGWKDRQHGGFIYLSEAYFQAKTISVMVHRDALLPGIQSRIQH